MRTAKKQTSRKLTVLPGGGRTIRGAVAILLLLGACKHASSPSNEQPKQATDSNTNAGTANVKDIFDPRLHPEATVVHPLDPHSLTASEVKFGIAPRRDPSVEYQPDIILMEKGDKAIKSVATDGLTWTFDANAPQVSDLEVGKIVFATSRAVGRILSLNRQGGSVSVILGPVQITDVILNGSFEMDQAVDLNNMISYVAPDYPQPADPSAQTKTSFNRPSSPNHVDESMILSRPAGNGKWERAAMMRTYGDGSRVSYHKEGRFWRANVNHPNRNANWKPGLGFGGAKFVRTSGQAIQMPGAPGVNGVHPLNIPIQPMNPPQMTGQPPIVDLGGMKAIPMAGSDGGVGVEYDVDQNGVKLRSSGYMTIRDSGIQFFLHIKHGIQDCGIRIKGNVGIKLHLNAASTQAFQANLHRKIWLPIDLSIPLGGPVPLSLTFDSAFTIDTAFSAKTSVLNAEGEYSFGAGIEAGYWAHDWRVNFSRNVNTITNIGDSIEGISVGINSVVMGFDVRTMIGIGAFGFSTGVYAGLRFAGTVLRSPDIAFTCRQGTIQAFIDTGVGYTLPGWAADAINFFIAPFTQTKIERDGAFMKGPSKELFGLMTQIPGGCASQAKGG
jgi:hypothetical protein